MTETSKKALQKCIKEWEKEAKKIVADLQYLYPNLIESHEFNSRTQTITLNCKNYTTLDLLIKDFKTKYKSHFLKNPEELVIKAPSLIIPHKLASDLAKPKQYLTILASNSTSPPKSESKFVTTLISTISSVFSKKTLDKTSKTTQDKSFLWRGKGGLLHPKPEHRYVEPIDRKVAITPQV